MDSLMLVSARSIIIYLFIIIAIRLFGKKELSQLSIVDLVFILLISNAVQAGMVGSNTSLAGAIVAAGTLFVMNLILKNLLYSNKKFSETLQGNPVMLVYQGKIIKKNLEKTRISKEELDASIREHGVADISHVDLAILEVDGNISVLSANFTKRTKKRRVHKSLGFTN